MANLTKHSFFDELSDFRSNLDHSFHHFLARLGSRAHASEHMLAEAPPVEAWIDKEDKKYHLRVALPGVDPKDVRVELQGSNLTVSGEHQSSEEKKEGNYLHQEFSYGQFQRTLLLPEGADTSKLSAEYNNGLLEISAPLSEAALPKQIEVKSAPKAKKAGA